MKRRQLFEFNDLGWFPENLRRFVTDGLAWGIRVFKMYDPAVSQIERLIKQSGSSQVIDLCSGAGGPWPTLVGQLSARGIDVSVTLTDLFPNEEAAGRAAGENLRYHPSSVDALHVPPELTGARTLFTGFHHFSPSQARLILEDAVKSRAAIGVFEFTERSPRSLAFAILGPLPTPLFAFVQKPFSVSRIFWNTLVPVLPLVNLWDGLVSSLRTYTPDELSAMVADLSDHHWETGLATEAGKRVTYLIGWPKERRS